MAFPSDHPLLSLSDLRLAVFLTKMALDFTAPDLHAAFLSFLFFFGFWLHYAFIRWCLFGNCYSTLIEKQHMLLGRKRTQVIVMHSCNKKDHGTI